MRNRRLLLLSAILAIVLIATACASATTPTAKPTTSPATTASPAAKPATTTSAPTTATASPTAKPTATATASGVNFAGKTVTIVVAVAAGGGTDIVARLVARNLAKYLPGQPTIIVKNMPGAGATIGANYAYGSKPDGMTVLAGSGSVILSQLFGSSAAKYDLTKMTAFVSFATAAIYHYRPNILSKPEDILKAKGVVFGHSPGGNGYGFLYSTELLGVPKENVKIILGYSGSGDARRAFLSGEINASTETGSGWSDVMKPLADKGETVPIFQVGLVDTKGNLIRDPSLPKDVITTAELYQKLYGKEPSGVGYSAYKIFIGATANYLKTYFLPSGTPDNIKQAFFTAGEQMLKDSDWQKYALATVGENVLSLAGKTAADDFATNFKMDPAAIEWLKATATKWGIVIEN